MKIALGTAQFGLDYGISNKFGRTSFPEMTEILAYAYSCGVNFLDTAVEYGTSEENIGKYLKNCHDEKWNVVSKLPKLENGPTVEVEFDRHFSMSKSRLGNFLDTYLCHDVQQFLTCKAVRDKFHKLLENESIRKIGVSIYTEQDIIDVLNLGGIDVIQVPISILDHRLIKSGTLKRIKACDIEIHARSIFLQGLFFLNNGELKSRFPDVVTPLNHLRNIANHHNLTLSELAMHFVDSLPEVDRIIVGVNTLQQLKTNLESYRKPYHRDITGGILDSIDYRNEEILNPSLW
jgi:aryl-alcohol dehydrogenase-like predicted oxidoreductase